MKVTEDWSGEDLISSMSQHVMRSLFRPLTLLSVLWAPLTGEGMSNLGRAMGMPVRMLPASFIVEGLLEMRSNPFVTQDVTRAPSQ